MQRALTIAWALVTSGCACPDEGPPPFEACVGGCEAALVVGRSSEADAAPDAFCVGFPVGRAPICQRGTARAPGWQPRSAGERLTWSYGVVFEGYPLSFETETATGGHGRLCFAWVSDTGSNAGNGCAHDWECASEGTVTFTAGGGVRVHAVFQSGGTIDLTLAAPP